jgi:ferric-dicitrate binding protein FerR (iron transport regulator)
MDGREWQLEDLLSDDRFREWIRNPQAGSRHFWEEWMGQHPARAELVQEARLILRSLPPQTYPTDPEVEESWQRFQARRQKAGTPGTAQRLGFLQTPLFRVAAVFLLFALLGAATWLYSGLAGGRVFATIATSDQKRTITLPDGSTALLNAHSQLRYRDDWAEEGDREIWLKGEAFFEVAKKPYHPAGTEKVRYARFVVHTSHLDVEVLGTQFNVNTHPENTRVVLREGKVKLDAAGTSPVVMQPGDWVEYKAQEKAMAKKAVNAELYTAWRQNRLVFNETPLREVAQLLEDNYGLSVEFDNPATAAKKLSGVMPADNLPLLLRAIEQSFALKAEQNGNRILIRKSNPK